MLRLLLAAELGSGNRSSNIHTEAKAAFVTPCAPHLLSSFSSRSACRGRRNFTLAPRTTSTITAQQSGDTPRNARNNFQRKRSRPRGRRWSLQEVIDAQRLRKQGNWSAAKALLDSVQSQAENDSNYLNEVLHVRAAQLRQTSPSISASDLYDELYFLSESVPAQTNATTFNAILMGLRNNSSTGNEVQGVRDVLEIAAKLFDTMLDRCVYPDHFTMSILFQMCATSRNATYATKFERKARDVFGFELNIVSGSALVAAYARCGQIELVESVLETLDARHIQINERTYAPIISAYHRCGLHALVMKHFRKAMASPAVKPNIYIFSSTLASCCKARDSGSALFVFETMERVNVSPTDLILDTLFETAIRSSDIELGEKVLYDWARKYGVIKPQVTHFNRLISACKKSGDSDNNTAAVAKGIVRRMKQDAGVQPDVSTFNSLISTLVRLGFSDDAGRVLQEDLLGDGLVPDVVTYNTLIHALGQAGRPSAALQLYQDMKEAGVAPSQVTYNTLIEQLLEAKEVEISISIAEEMRRDPNVVMDSVVLSSHLKAYRKSGDVRAAMRMFSQSLREGNFLDEKAYGLVLTILFESNREAEGISIFGWLLWKHVASASSFNVVLDHFGRQAQTLGHCFAIFESMKRKRVAPDAMTYTIMIRTCSRHGQIDRAFRYLGEMQDVGIGLGDSFSWTALIDGCGRAGQWQRAVELLRSMQDENARSKFVPSPTTASYNAALYAAGMHGGGWKVASDIYKGLVADEKQEPDMVTYSAMASAILRNRSEITEWEIVKEVYEQLKAVAGNGHARQTLPGRRLQRLSGSNVKRDKYLSKKLNAKMKRLNWLLRREGSRNEYPANRDSADDDNN